MFSGQPLDMPSFRCSNCKHACRCGSCQHKVAPSKVEQYVPRLLFCTPLAPAAVPSNHRKFLRFTSFHRRSFILLELRAEDHHFIPSCITSQTNYQSNFFVYYFIAMLLFIYGDQNNIAVCESQVPPLAPHGYLNISRKHLRVLSLD